MTRGGQFSPTGLRCLLTRIPVHGLAIRAFHPLALATGHVGGAVSGSCPDLVQPRRQGVGRGRGLLQDELVAGLRHLDKPAQG